jgi:hypothetical protein
LWGQWGEMNQSLYAHMNNKRKMKKKKKIFLPKTHKHIIFLEINISGFAAATIRLLNMKYP